MHVFMPKKAYTRAAGSPFDGEGVAWCKKHTEVICCLIGITSGVASVRCP
jgi:hypothetical protein